MGWNSWNTFGCEVKDSDVRAAAKAMVDSGMSEAGYKYVVVDDCWFNPQRDPNGNLQGDPTNFPDMKALGDYIHNLKRPDGTSAGMKFGLYMAPVDRTCAQFWAYPGSTSSNGHEEQDARQFEAWGVDYLKYDWCSEWGTRDDQVARFTKMRDALRATGRPIVYSVNPNSYHKDDTGETYNWGQIADLWRTTEDLRNIWQNGNTNATPMGVLDVVDINAPLAAQAGPGHWNDPDMLAIGMPKDPDYPELEPIEKRTHFALWALMGAPLMSGNNPAQMSAEDKEILLNRRLIEVNQDSLGAGGRRVRVDGAAEVFAKPLADGSVAIGLLNRGDGAATITTSATEIGLSGGSFTLTDLWNGNTSTTTGEISASVPRHGVAVFKVSGGTPIPSSTNSLKGADSGRCIDVEGGKPRSAAKIVIFDCHGAANQLWTEWPNGELRVFGNLCLDAAYQGTENDTQVIAWPCNGQLNQQWTFEPDGTIKGVQSGLCLDVRGAATTNGSPLILWDCHDNAGNQRWTRS